jgi:hypothetical protein
LLIWSIATANIGTKIDSAYPSSWLAARDKSIRDGDDVGEYTTVWNHATADLDASYGASSPPRVAYDRISGDISVLSWQPRHIVLAANLNQATRVSVHQFYFPTWYAETVRGARVPLTPSTPEGFIDLVLPAGQYEVRLTLKLLTQELTGDILTAAGIFVVFLLQLQKVRRHLAFRLKLTDHLTMS